MTGDPRHRRHVRRGRRRSPSSSTAAADAAAVGVERRCPPTTTSTTSSCSAWAAAASPATCSPPSPGPFMPVPVVVRQGLRARRASSAPRTLVLRRVVLGRHRGDRRGRADGRHRRGAQRGRASAGAARWPRWRPPSGRPDVAVRRRHPHARGPALGALAVPAAARARAGSGFFPGAAGVDRRRRRPARSAAATSSSPTATRPSALARRIGRADPARLRRRRPRRRGGAALEEPGQRERQGARLLPTRSPSSATTRSAAGASTATSPARSSPLVELRHDFEHPQVAAALRPRRRRGSTRSSTRCTDVRGRGRGRAGPAARPHAPSATSPASTWPPSTASTPGPIAGPRRPRRPRWALTRTTLGRRADRPGRGSSPVVCRADPRSGPAACPRLPTRHDRRPPA